MNNIKKNIKNLLKYFFILIIRFYQKFLSPVFGGQCRFYPTCSEYAIQCFENLPLHKAILKSVWRILRCQPLSKGYEDELIIEKKK